MTLLLDRTCPAPWPEVPPYLEELASEIREEFDDLPGLRLTEAQIRRRWLLTEEESAAAIEYLLRTRYLVQEPGGRYGRRWRPSASGARIAQ